MCRPSRDSSASAFSPPPLHHGEARQNRDMVAGADLVDDRDEPLVARLVRAPSGVNCGSTSRSGTRAARAAATPLSTVARNSASSTPTRASLVPTCQITSSAQPAFSAALSRCSVLTASSPPTPGVLHVGGDAVVPRQLVLEPRRIGVRGRAGPDPLGGRRADRQDLERAVRAAVQARELRSVGSSADAGRHPASSARPGAAAKTNAMAREARTAAAERRNESGPTTGGADVFLHSIQRAMANRAATPANVYASPARCSTPTVV